MEVKVQWYEQAASGTVHDMTMTIPSTTNPGGTFILKKEADPRTKGGQCGKLEYDDDAGKDVKCKHPLKCGKVKTSSDAVAVETCVDESECEGELVTCGAFKLYASFAMTLAMVCSM